MTNAKAVRPDDLPARAPARWSHSPGTPPSAPAITSVENGKSTGKTPPLRYSTRIRIGRSAAITVTSRSWPIYRQGAPQNGAAQRLLRDRPIIFCRRTAWASPQAVHHGYHVRDPPAAGTGVNSGGCFFFRCFVDLQEAYDTVDRALLWQALTHIGVPLSIEMIAVIRQFNDGIRVCVRGQTAGECSEWFQVGQGLRQGCVSVFTTAVLIHTLLYVMTIQRLSSRLSCVLFYRGSARSRTFSKYLVHLKEEPITPGPKTELGYVEQAVWGMLDADDACVISQSPQGLTKMISIFVQICGAFGFTFSEKYTETMCTPKPQALAVDDTGNEKCYEQAEFFAYPGRDSVTETPHRMAEITRRKRLR